MLDILKDFISALIAICVAVIAIAMGIGLLLAIAFGFPVLTIYSAINGNVLGIIIGALFTLGIYVPAIWITVLVRKESDEQCQD